MKDQSAAFQQMLEKYRFVQEAAPPVRRHVLANSGRSLRSTLKKLGRYNPLLGAIVLVFLASKRLGIGLSMLQSATVTVVSAAVVAGSVATGGYYGVKTVVIQLQKQEQKQEEQEAPAPEELPDDADRAEKKETVMSLPVIAIEPFTVMSIDNNDGVLVVDALRKEMKTLCAGKCLVGISRNPDMVLRGQLVGAEGSCTLFVRLVGRDGQIFFARSFTGESSADLAQKAGTIADEICRGLR